MRSRTVVSIAFSVPIALFAGGAMAATLIVDQHDAGCSAVASPFCTISQAVDAAFAGEEIVVEPGNYVENVTIDVSVALVSSGGRSVTIIEGISGAGSLGTIVIAPNLDGVQIGDIDQGFTIIGIDNGNPGIENAAVYFQGNHAGAGVLGNEIIANGDHGLLTEFGVTITDFEIRENEFAGTTFFPPPATGNQFEVPNVPRQLVVMGGGAGGGNTSDITFSNNLITGTSGGVNLDGDQQGNTQVTIDAVGAVIHDNVFLGTTTGFGTSLRARGPDTDIAGNTFDDAGLSDSACYIFVQEVGDTLGKIRGRNTFVDRQAIVDPAPNETTGAICPRD
jgi:hypothetical protein